MEPGAELTEELRRIGLASGLAAVGVTAARPWSHTRGILESRRAVGLAGGMAFTYRNPARSSDPSRILARAASLVVGAWPYAQQTPDRPVGLSARVARYATDDHYGDMERALGHIATRLREDGHRALVMSDDNSLVDREAAWRAGIGFTGKNANVLLPGRGSWFVLGSVVTDAVLPNTTPPVAEQCGSCRRCLDGCPTGAIVSSGTVDAGRCLAWLLQRPGRFPHEFRVALGDRIYGCDDCQEVCPPSRREEAGTGRVAGPDAWLDVLDLLDLDDERLLDRCDRWYIPGRDPNVIRRNLLVIVGNSGREAGRPVLVRYAADGDPILSEHATWALARLDELAASGSPASRPATVVRLERARPAQQTSNQ